MSQVPDFPLISHPGKRLQISRFLRVLHLKSFWWECLQAAPELAVESATAPLGSHCNGCAPLQSYLLAEEEEDIACPELSAPVYMVHGVLCLGWSISLPRCDFGEVSVLSRTVLNYSYILKVQEVPHPMPHLLGVSLTGSV